MTRAIYDPQVPHDSAVLQTPRELSKAAQRFLEPQYPAEMLVQPNDQLDKDGALRAARAEVDRLRRERLADAAPHLLDALRKYVAAGFGNSTDFYKQGEAYDAAMEAIALTGESA